MSKRLAIGVDIGGTKIAFGLIDEQGTVMATHRLPTLPGEGGEAVLDRIAQGVDLLVQQAQGDVLGVGIGCPGYLTPATGIVHEAVNLSWLEVPLRDGVKARLKGDIPVWIQKDTNAGALGEMYFGAARGYKDLVYIAIGTGLGGSAVVNGEIVLGNLAYAMEIGHWSAYPGGRLCGCGLHGCPEMYASGVGLMAGVREYLPQYPDSPLAQGEIDPPAILEAARANDPLACKAMDDLIGGLGLVMAGCAAFFNPALFVIGGGLGNAGRDLIMERARQQLAARTVLPSNMGVRVVPSQVQNSAVGPACLVWRELQRRSGSSV
jgi:glucokinase